MLLFIQKANYKIYIGGAVAGKNMPELTLEKIYAKKSKFLQKHMDAMLKHTGKGDFIRKILFRAWRMYEAWDIIHPDWINYDNIESRLNNRFTGEELEVLHNEKKRRAQLKKALKGHEYREFYPDDLPKDKITPPEAC